MHVNVNSIVAGSKLDEISAIVSDYDIDIVAVTESWLGDSIESDDISLDGFQPPIRRDRNRHGGGVLIYISNTIPCKRRDDLEVISSECIWLELQIGIFKILFATYYRPPGQNISMTNDFMDQFINAVNTAHSELPDAIVVTGDFNSKHNEWWHLDPVNYAGAKLRQATQIVNLQQIITEPTCDLSQSPSLIDLIFTDSPEFFTKTPSLSNCHHSPIIGYMRFLVSVPNRILELFGTLVISIMILLLSSCQIPSGLIYTDAEQLMKQLVSLYNLF